MNVWKKLAPLVVITVGWPLVSAETWQTTLEERSEGNLSRVYGAMALISGRSAAGLPLE